MTDAFKLSGVGNRSCMLVYFVNNLPGVNLGVTLLFSYLYEDNEVDLPEGVPFLQQLESYFVCLT